MKRMLICLLLLCLLLPAARAETAPDPGEDPVCVAPGDTGFDTAIVLQVAEKMGFIKFKEKIENTYREEYVAGVQKMEKAMGLTDDGIIHVSEIEDIDGVLYQGASGSDVEKMLEHLADLGYLTSLAEKHDTYTDKHAAGVKKAEKALGLASDGYVTRKELKAILAVSVEKPAALQGLKITAQSGKATLKWNASKNAVGYRITRTIYGDVNKTDKVADVKGTTWTDSDPAIMGRYVSYTVTPYRYSCDGTGRSEDLYINPAYKSVTASELNANTSKYMNTFVKVTTNRSSKYTFSFSGDDCLFRFPCGNGNYVFLKCVGYKQWTWNGKALHYYKDVQVTAEGKVVEVKTVSIDGKSKKVPVVEVDNLNYTYWN